MFLVKNFIILTRIHQKISFFCYNLKFKQCNTSWWFFFSYTLNVKKMNVPSTSNKLKTNKNISELSLSKESTNTFSNNPVDETSDSVGGPNDPGWVSLQNIIGYPNTRVHRSGKVFPHKSKNNTINYITNKMANDLRLTPPPVNLVPYENTFLFYQNQIDQRYFGSHVYENNRSKNTNISNKSLFNSGKTQNPPKQLSRGKST